jgi:hypothetical protein
MIVVAFLAGLLLAHHHQSVIPPFTFTQDGFEVQERFYVNDHFVTVGEWHDIVPTCKRVAVTYDTVPDTDNTLRFTLYCET